LRQAGNANQDECTHWGKMASRQADRDFPSERMTDENNRALNPIEQVLLHQIGVVHRVPIGRREWSFAKPGQVDQMHAMRVLKERRNPTQAFTIAAPSVQKYQMMGRRLSTDFVDEAGSAVLEALDADESTSQG
jgi:hypothetical protein